MKEKWWSPDSIYHLKSRQRLLANFVRWKPFGNSPEGPENASLWIKKKQKPVARTLAEYQTTLNWTKGRESTHFLICIFVWPVRPRRRNASFSDETIVSHAYSVSIQTVAKYDRRGKKRRKYSLTNYGIYCPIMCNTVIGLLCRNRNTALA